MTIDTPSCNGVKGIYEVIEVLNALIIQAGAIAATALNGQVVALAGGNGASSRAGGHKTLSAGANTARLEICEWHRQALPRHRDLCEGAMKNGMGWACALLVWLWAALAAAAPEISGVSWNGDGTVTITGAGFGPGPLSALLVFDRFDDEQPGATLDNAASEYGAWTTQLRSPRAASTLPRFSGDVCWDAHGTDIDEPRRFEKALPNVREVFVSFDTTLGSS